MKEFQEKRRIRKILTSRGSLAALSVLLALALFSTARVYMRSRLATAKNEEVKKEIAEMKKRKEDLEKEIGRLKSDFGMEQELRKRFNVQRPGEKVLVIVDKGRKIDLNKKDPESFWAKFWKKAKEVF